jgi:drug/metabolite transporter (DMT)-like permease
LILKAYEHGKIGVITGVGATYALVPLAYSFFLGESIGGIGAVGLVFVLLGLLIFYVPAVTQKVPGESHALSAILVALAAALCWGLAVIVLDIGTRVSVTGTMFISQIPQVLVALVLATAVKKVWGRIDRRSTIVIVGAGFAVALAQISFFTAANEGDIGVVSVLSSLSPLVTTLLAVILLREWLRRREVVALVVVVAGTCLIAAA